MVIILTSTHQNQAEVLAVCANVKEAKACAQKIEAKRQYWYFWMLDLDAGCWRDSHGRKKKSYNLTVSRLLMAHKTGEWTTGAEVIGIDQPGMTPVWMRTHAEMAMAWGDNDIYTGFA